MFTNKERFEESFNFETDEYNYLVTSSANVYSSITFHAIPSVDGCGRMNSSGVGGGKTQRCYES